MYLLQLVLLWYSDAAPIHSSLTSSWRPAHVSWLELFGKFSLLEAFLILRCACASLHTFHWCGSCVFLHPDILGPNHLVQNRTPALLGEVILDDQFLSWIWYGYNRWTLKLAPQRRLCIGLSPEMWRSQGTQHKLVPKTTQWPNTEFHLQHNPWGFPTPSLDETYALKTHRYLSIDDSSFLHVISFPPFPASTLTSAVWQNSTKAGLLESKETSCK